MSRAGEEFRFPPVSRKRRRPSAASPSQSRSISTREDSVELNLSGFFLPGESRRRNHDLFQSPVEADGAERTTVAATGVDDASREWSSEEDARPASRVGSRPSVAADENGGRSGGSDGHRPEQPDERASARRRSAIAREPLRSKAASPTDKSPDRGARRSPIYNSPSKRGSRCGSSRNLVRAKKSLTLYIYIYRLNSRPRGIFETREKNSLKCRCSCDIEKCR